MEYTLKIENKIGIEMYPEASQYYTCVWQTVGFADCFSV